jgi:hypothetical protein
MITVEKWVSVLTENYHFFEDNNILLGWIRDLEGKLFVKDLKTIKGKP